MKEEHDPPKYAIGQPLYYLPLNGYGFCVRPIQEPNFYFGRWGNTWMYSCIDEYGNKRELLECNLRTLPGLKNSIKRYIKAVK